MTATDRPEADPAKPPPPKRVALFLQGPPTPFWTDLARALLAEGAEVRKVCVSLPDRLFWRGGPATHYRGRFRGWRRWLRDYVRREGVTDILYYADRQPYHRVAQKVARAEGIGAFAIEHGYLRPDWLTLEREGGGAFSHFPENPALLDPDAPLPDFRPRFRQGRFSEEAVRDVAYNLADVVGRPLYPFFWSDRYYAAIPDYLHWLARLAVESRLERRSAQAQAALFASGAPFFLLALQLQSDYQLRGSSPFAHQADAAALAIDAFARAAPAEARLVVKLHPLANRRERLHAHARRLAAEAGVADRIVVLEKGDLDPLVRASEGVLTINSTVGIHALKAGRPVATMGEAVYAIDGVTDNRALDAFFAGPAAPDRTLTRTFLATLAQEIQIRGSLHEPAGRSAAAAEMARRIVEGRVGPSCWRPGAAPPRALRVARERLRRRRGAPLGAGGGDGL